MSTVPGFTRTKAAALALVCVALASPPSAGCAPQATAPAPAPVAAPTAAVFAGVAYDPRAALSATERPLFEPRNPPAEARTYAVRFAGGGGQPVPGLLTVPGGKAGARRPSVLLLHGLGGRKEDFLILQTALARRGYVSLSIDIAGHGQRPGIGGRKVSELSLAQMRTLVAQTVVDLRRGADYLAARPEADPARLGFLGVSLGGIIGGSFVGEEPRVRGAVLWAAGGDWGTLIGTSQHAFAKGYRKRGVGDAAQIRAALADVDPVRYIGKAAGRPLLFLNGTRDEVVPRASTDALFAAAAQPKRIEFLPGGHIPDASGMLLRSLDWLDVNVKR